MSRVGGTYPPTPQHNGPVIANNSGVCVNHSLANQDLCPLGGGHHHMPYVSGCDSPICICIM